MVSSDNECSINLIAKRSGKVERKAPFVRELPTESGEGERVTVKTNKPQCSAGSFRHSFAVSPPSRREALAPTLVFQKGTCGKIFATSALAHLSSFLSEGKFVRFCFTSSLELL